MTVKYKVCGFVDETTSILPIPLPNARGTASKYGNLVCRKCGSKNIVFHEPEND